MRTVLAALVALLCATVGTAQQGASPASPAPAPFWSSTRMEGESVLFVRRGGKAPVADLLFIPTKILSVRSSSGAVTYLEGRDYNISPGSRTITIPAGSKIPVQMPKTLTPPLGSQPYDLKRRDGKGDILFGAGHEYADMQVEVTYEHEPAEWGPAPPKLAERELPNVLKKLSDGNAVTIVFFGDSITEGGNASKQTGVAPLMPPYPDLLVRRLESAYRSKITWKNLSVGGMTAEYGRKHIDTVAAEHPDLVVLAWGMNDSSGRTPRAVRDFISDLADQITAVVKEKPEAEFILVSSMLPNPDCCWANPQALLDYRDAMRTRAGQHIAVADLTSMWEAMLKTKSYLDITGNGVNHPNDFGHRIYADVLAALLIPRRQAP